MSSDDQHFLDILSSIPNDVKRYSLDVADAIERHFDMMASSIRSTLSAHNMLPASAKPSPPPSRISGPKSVSFRYWESAQGWVSRNRALTAAIVAFVGTGGFLVWRRRKGYIRKRRARRASNGARSEVVVLGGSATSAITRSIALDLERRGFIVYVIVSTSEDEHNIENEGRADIRSLNLDIGDPSHTKHAVERFHHLLSNAHHAYAGATPHNLKLAGVIFLPNLSYPSGPVEAISPEQWSDALNVKILGTIATIQAFLPLVREFRARIILLTPSIVSALSLPFHGPETTVVKALEGFTASLRGELIPFGVEVCHLKLGTFHVGDAKRPDVQPGVRANLISWPSSFRSVYGCDYAAESTGAGYQVISSAKGAKGTPLRVLHNSIFDALTQRRPVSVRRVGRGSLVYDVVGNWAPTGLVGWMLAIRKSSREGAENVPPLDDSTQWEQVDSVV